MAARSSNAALVMAARQDLAQASLKRFACLADIPTVPLGSDEEQDAFSVMKLDSLAAHHELVCDALQRVEMAVDGFSEAEGAIPNLMVLMPPGSAKSTYADVLFIPWVMARKPRRPVILASYGDDLARKQGKRARALAGSAIFANLMSCGLQPGNRSAEEWALTNGSEFMSGGLLTGLTGNRAALGVLDDPLKGRQEAESKTIRNKVWDAYVDDFCTRLKPGAPQVMILTRWHQDDPAGRILPEKWDGESGWIDGRDKRRWYVICLPAIADRPDDPLGRALDEPLWPEWFKDADGDPMGHWRPFMINHRTWSSLFQQKPTSEEGTYFKREWFPRYKAEERPKNLRIVMTSDHAPGGTDKSDFNVVRVWGVDSNRHAWLLDGIRAQGTLDAAMGVKILPDGSMALAVAGALPLIKKWKPRCWFPEADNNWKAIAGFVRAAMLQTGVACVIDPITTAGGDKETKAQAFQTMAHMGQVHLPEGEMGDEVLAQYLAFPGGKWDDEVDAGANLGRALDKAHPAFTSTALPAEKRDPYGLEEESDGVDWFTV